MEAFKQRIFTILKWLTWLAMVPAVAFVASQDLKFSVMIVGALFALTLVVTSFFNYKLGVYYIMVISLTSQLPSRLAMTDIQIGVFIDMLIFASFLGSWIYAPKNPNKVKVEFMRDPFLVCIYLYILYFFVQFFNPNTYSHTGWFYYLRGKTRVYLFLFLAMKAFNHYGDMKTFFKFWLAASSIAALYGVAQKWVGIFPYERAYMAAFPEKFRTFMMAEVRAFSFLSDPAVFGLVMGCGVIICVILLTGSSKTVSPKRKWQLFAILAVHLLALGYSGTRTAYVIVPGGLIIFFLTKLHDRNTIFAAMVFGVLAMAVLYGPFYSPTIIRIRTAFIGSKDASLNVRDVNRAKIQPYIYQHPIGGGVMTAGGAGEVFNPGHPLAGFPPDSGYLRALLEMGWLGLIFVALLTYYGVRYSVSNYFSSRDEMARLLNLCMAGCLMAIAVAQYAQEPAGLMETAMFMYILWAISIKMKYHNKQQQHAEA